MEWDHIRKSWRQLVRKIVAPQSTAWDAQSHPNSSAIAATSIAAAFSAETPEPYVPEYRRDQNESSLHLSS